MLRTRQASGRKKTTTAVAYLKRICGPLRVNGRSLDHIKRKILQKLLQLLGKEKFANVDLRIRGFGGGHVAHSFHQAIPKALVSFKCTPAGHL